MKKKQIIGLSVAVLGALATVSTSLALYEIKSADKGFDITINTPTVEGGNIKYIVGEPTSNLKEGEKLSPAHKEATYTMLLKGEHTKMPAQDILVGELGVTFSGDIINSGLVETYAWVDGYRDNSYGVGKYGGHLDLGKEHSGKKEIAVESKGTQLLHVQVKLKNDLTDAQFAGLAESKYNINITWGQSVNYKAPYIVGDANGWKELPEYIMMPNIHASSEEWMFNGLTGFSKMKIRQNGQWLAGNNEGNDLALETGKTYNVFWKGKGNLQVKGNEIITL